MLARGGQCTVKVSREFPTASVDITNTALAVVVLDTKSETDQICFVISLDHLSLSLSLPLSLSLSEEGEYACTRTHRHQACLRLKYK